MLLNKLNKKGLDMELSALETVVTAFATTYATDMTATITAVVAAISGVLILIFGVPRVYRFIKGL